MTGPYSRLYWSVMDDDKFDGIREDVRLFGSWSLLLVVADMAYPVPAYIPPTIPKSAVRRLVDCGLVDELPGHRFRVHGLEAERAKRTHSARNAAASRWHSDGNAETMPSRDRDETESIDRDETPRDAADVYWNLTGKFPTGRALEWIDNLASSYGSDAAIRALVKAHTADKAVSNLLTRTQDLLRADARKLDVKERQDEQARLAEKRAQPRVEEPWRAEFREAIRKQYEDVA